MSYTLEQKREAQQSCALWWRHQKGSDEYERSWTRVSNLLDGSEFLLMSKGAEYHIGDKPPTPPRVLSELEGELLEALKRLIGGTTSMQDALEANQQARAAIQKAEAPQ